MVTVGKALSGMSATTGLCHTSLVNNTSTKNRKHRRYTAKLAACTKPLMLSTVRGQGARDTGREEGRVI